MNEDVLFALSHIFNLSISLKQGKFIDCFKVAKIVSVYKSDERNDINNYRSFSLLPQFSKLLEKVAYKRLNFHEHIKITETKVARSVEILNKLKYYLLESAMSQLYYSLVHSQLIYGVAVWGNTFHSYLAKLTRLQNKALRFVTSSDWNASAAPLHQKLNILSLSKLNKF